ncbi:MAG: hypothetical protein SXV54_16025 [Chloroflexota bacterium]|nr:hypothetical protein [Chloroflexota bacterium]
MTRSLEFTARVAPVQQADLFFRADSHLSRLPKAIVWARERGLDGEYSH